MIISDHAVIRYLERTGSMDKIKEKITNGMVSNTAIIKPVNSVANAMTNKYRPTKTLHSRGTNLVYVIRENTLVTVIGYNEKLWKETKGITVIDHIYAPIEHHQKIRDFIDSLEGGVA